jgi:hypothetical protein
MTALYGLPGVILLLVRRLAEPSGNLRNRVNAWWRIFPIVTVALLPYPLWLPSTGAMSGASSRGNCIC